ncbi:Carboxypeptidase B [Blattella germanica]|nr:Carboxypeptidase B [Blattella germanica]
MSVVIFIFMLVPLAITTGFGKEHVTKIPQRLKFGKFYRYEEINTFVETLATRYPTKLKVRKIGNSSEGRDVKVVQLSSGGSGKRPVIFVLAGIHASDRVTPALGLYIVQQLLFNNKNKDLVDYVDWFVLPLLNPDGYEYRRLKDSQWIKSRSNSSGTNCIGVSLDRNFDFHWNGPFSEPETIAVRNLIMEQKGRVKLYLELQGTGSEKLAIIANSALKTGGDNSYKIGSYATLLSPVSGTAMDWMKGIIGVPLTYTVKITNPPGRHAIPEKFIKSTIANFFPAVRAFGTYIKQHYKI